MAAARCLPTQRIFYSGELEANRQFSTRHQNSSGWGAYDFEMAEAPPVFDGAFSSRKYSGL